MEWNIYVLYKKAWRGKHIALASSQGCPIESFAQLPFYCYNLKKENEGTVTDIEKDDKGRFKMCFIGFGVAEFLMLYEAVDHNRWHTFEMDLLRNKSCYCWHGWKQLDYTYYHWCVTRFKELYWKTCKAYTHEDFEKLMYDIHALRPDAHQKLVDARIEKWSRAKFPTNKYNYMTSNIVESIYALTKDNMVRKKLKSTQQEESSQGKNNMSESGTNNQEKDEKQSQNDKTEHGMEKL
ncbi:hypothetical protein Tco_1317704, partial [Tanacetum coccineum]